MNGKNIDVLIRELKEKGEKINKEVTESINSVAFRLLEQVRLGNKDSVYYMLLRCFVANEKKFPDELMDAFKPENDKYFKTLIFSFLAPILGEK